MAPSSSSTKKAARLTQRGKGRSIRFQGGTLFPLIVAVVIVLGLGTVVYARQSVPAADASRPTIDDHWHAAYGFYICGEWYTLAGAQEQLDTQGRLVSTTYLQTGVHSHDDGVIHWHAFTSRAVGRRANLGVFLDVYDIELSNDRLTFPDGQPSEGLVGEEFVAGEFQCDGEDTQISVVTWDQLTDTDAGTRYIANFDNIRVQNSGMVFAIAVMPRGEPVPMPPWAPNLPELGAIDMTQIDPQMLIDQGLLPEGVDPDIFPEGEEEPTDGEPTGDEEAPTGDEEAPTGDDGSTDDGSTDDGE